MATIQYFPRTPDAPSGLINLIDLEGRPDVEWPNTYWGWRKVAEFYNDWMNKYRRKMIDLYEIHYVPTANALAELNNDIAQRDITIGNMVTRIGDFTTRIGNLTTLINSLSTDNTETKRQRDEAIAQRGELQVQHDELRGQHDETTKERDELKGQYGELQVQYDTALNNLRDATEQLGDVQDTVGTYENKWREDNPDLADKGLDFPTFIDLTDAFASEDPEKIGSAIGTLEGMGINPADIKGERFKFGEGEDEKEYIPTDPPEIPGLFDPEYPEFEKEAEEFLKDEERKLEFFNEFDRAKALEKDPYATPEDKGSAWENFIQKAGPFGSLIGGFASVASPLIKFFQPGEDETPGGEPVTDYRLPKITRKIPDLNLGLDIPISGYKSLVDFSSGKRGLTPEYVEPPVPGVFQTGVRPGEKIPEFELKYEDKPYVGLFAKKEDKEGNYLQYPSFGKDKLKYPEAALL